MSRRMGNGYQLCTGAGNTCRYRFGACPIPEHTPVLAGEQMRATIAQLGYPGTVSDATCRQCGFIVHAPTCPLRGTVGVNGVKGVAGVSGGVTAYPGKIGPAPSFRGWLRTNVDRYTRQDNRASVWQDPFGTWNVGPKEKPGASNFAVVGWGRFGMKLQDAILHADFELSKKIISEAPELDLYPHRVCPTCGYEVSIGMRGLVDCGQSPEMIGSRHSAHRAKWGLL